MGLMTVSFRAARQGVFRVFLGVLAWTVPAWAIVGGQVGGPLEASAVMVLHDRGGLCTGIVLASDVVLTAAHCVPPGANVRVFFRQDDQPVLLEPRLVVRHPDFRSNAVQERTRSIDLALIRMSAPLPGRFTAAALASSPPGADAAAITVAGFGLSREGDPSATGTWRSAPLRTSSPYGPSKILLWARAAPGVGACQGDSGGPIIGPGGDVVAAVSWSTGQRGGKCGELTQGALLAPQRGWIDATLASWSRQASWR